MTAQFQQTVWSQLLIGTIVRAGIRHAVVSPGSRSTPFLTALLAETSVLLHPIIDERSAGFIGIGLARASGKPVLLLCTSGTAAANYHPAVVEADLAGVPLVILTADRPFDAQHASCPQTIDQNQLYGNHVRAYFELGEAPSAPDALRSFRRLLMSALQLATGPSPGPVHLNARAHKPLQACEPGDDNDRTIQRTVRALLREKYPSAILGEASPDARSMQAVAADCVQTRRGLIVCGFDAETPALDPEELAQFARATGFPVWLDVTHPLRWAHPAALAAQIVHCAELLWGCPRFSVQYSPNLVVQLGPSPTSKHWGDWLERVGARQHIVFARRGWPDPAGRASAIILGDPSKTLQACTRAIESNCARVVVETPWLLDWQPMDSRAQQSLESWIASNGTMGELQAVRTVLETCARGTRVVLGNSLPVREADLVLPAADRGLYSFAIRGANGIDGVLSAAVGAALSDVGPTLLLLGDVSFLHDIGSLHAARRVKSPLVIVVLDNCGGRIFEQLPIFEAASANDLAYWTTPHELGLEAAGTLYGIQTVLPADLAELRFGVCDALKRPCATLLIVKVDPSLRRGVESLRRAVDAALFA